MFTNTRIGRSTRLTKEEETISANYVIQAAPRYHEAFAVTSDYSLQTAQFEPISADNHLYKALQDYNANCETPSQKLNVEHCTLKDVVLELEEAENAYQKKAGGRTGFIRQGARLIGDNYDALAPWLGLIPTDHGLNFLSAGLTIIFKIAKKNAENREKILQAFHEIPDIIINAQEYQQLFASSKQLQERAISLFKTLVQSLANLISLLNGKPESKFIKIAKKVVSSEHIGYEIDKILEEVQRSTRSFKERLSLTKSEILNQTRDMTTTLVTGQRDLQQQAASIKQCVAGTESKIDDMRREIREKQFQQYVKYHSGIEAQNLTLVFIRNDYPASGNSLPRTQPFQSQSFMSADDLFKCLCILAQQSIDDVDQILQQLNQFDGPAHEQARQLLSNNEFTQWMGSAHSNALFVQGNFHMPGPCRISPLSALCALFSLNLSKNSPCIVLRFFCGLHEAHNGPIHGPNGLIRSFLTQLLLTSFSFNLDFINTRDFFEGIKSHSLRDLCSVFRQLIEQLPPSARVVCIIDNVNSFECDSGIADLKDVFYILGMIMTNPYLRPVVKLLATTPFSQRLITEQEIYNPRHVFLRPVVVGAQRMNERNIGNLCVGRSHEEYLMKMRKYAEEESEDDDEY